jgi:hypothetical protein
MAAKVVAMRIASFMALICKIKVLVLCVQILKL